VHVLPDNLELEPIFPETSQESVPVLSRQLGIGVCRGYQLNGVYVRADNRFQLLGDIEIDLVVVVSQPSLPPRDRA